MRQPEATDVAGHLHVEKYQIYRRVTLRKSFDRFFGGASLDDSQGTFAQILRQHHADQNFACNDKNGLYPDRWRIWRDLD